MKKSLILLYVACSLLANATWAAAPSVPFPGSWQKFGRAEMTVGTDSVTIANGFLADLSPRGDCELCFRAKMPVRAEQVQIWGAVRVKDRENRYVFGLRGGVEPELTLARYAADGKSRFLGCAPLSFTPAPGQWYSVRVVVCGQRFQVYLNDEKLPRINVVDDVDVLWKDGGVALGGGWLPAEFAEVNVRPLTGEALTAVQAVGDRTLRAAEPDRNEARIKAREAYRPAIVPKLPEVRGEVSLDGNWLFMPDQDLPTGARPDAAAGSDQDWHTIAVPSMWTPTFPWLHGEGTKPGRNGIAFERSPSDKLLAAEYNRVNSQTFAWEKTKSGWYRHYLELPARLEGRRLELVFDAIAKMADVYVNGVKTGSNVGMFRQVRCNITGAVKPGKNLIAVHVIGIPAKRVKNANSVQAEAVTVEVTNEMLKSLPHGIMSNNVSGIWQPVRLVITDPVRVDEVYVRPRLDGAAVDVDLANDGTSERTVVLSYTIRDLGDGTALLSGSQNAPVRVPPGGKISTTIETPKLQPKLWSPQSPNLYALELKLSADGRTLDRHTTRFGFRTFRADGGRLLLNGKPWFIRGANHFPITLKPNDPGLARAFMKKAREGNVWATRSVCMPFTRTWLDAADEVGMGVSQEGTWAWLMLPTGLGGEKKETLPDTELLALWKSEYSDLLRQWRNHPSILIWTVNNEMKFHTHPTKDTALLKQKWTVLDDMIKTMRKIDPTRPIVADSDYLRKLAEPVSGGMIRENRFDDGDIDDAHRYYGWYNSSFFHLLKGEFGKDHGTPGRPLISQEWGGGYPRDDGWAVRSYLFGRYVAQALAGDGAMEGSDPALFLTRHSMLAKELTEVVRRTNRDEVAGLMPFSYLTWFSEVWDAARMKPRMQYYEIKKALQPVLLSAELTGRHFYGGESVTRRVCIVNDSDTQADVPAGTLAWEIRDGEKILAKGSLPAPAVPYYSNQWVNATFRMPSALPCSRVGAKLVLTLLAGSRTLACNDYDIVLADRDWAMPSVPGGRKLALFDPAGKAKTALAGLEITPLPSLDALTATAPLVVGDLGALLQLPDGAMKLRAFIEAGGRALLLQPGAPLVKFVPEFIKSFRATQGEIVSMVVPESPVFDGLQPLDLAWFEMGAGEIPYACAGTYEVNREQPGVHPLAHQCEIHGAHVYGPSKVAPFFTLAGAPIVEIRMGKGMIVVSDMMVSTRANDPVAGRLLANMIRYISNTDSHRAWAD